MLSADAVIPNNTPKRHKGVYLGSGGRLNINERSYPNNRIPAKGPMGNVLTIGKNGRMQSVLSCSAGGDRMSLPGSEPAATIRSSVGFKGKINFETPTIVAPIARASFAGGGIDSQPTVTPMTASQSRIATTITKKRMLKKAGKHYTSPYQTPKLFDRSAPENSLAPPTRRFGRKYSKRKEKKGNRKNVRFTGNLSTILEPPNQEDTDVTSSQPNPLDPLPPNDPIEQQGVQFTNYHGKLRTPMRSKNFPFLLTDRQGRKNEAMEKQMDPTAPSAAESAVPGGLSVV